MCDVNSGSRIKNNENIWSLAVIDNIDFMEKTFAYGNIFDTTRRSVHATLRMLFQFEFSKPIKQILGVVQNITNPRDQRVLFGESIYTNNFLNTCEYILSDFLKKPRRDWDHNSALDAIKQTITTGCNIAPPNVIILNPGETPNCNINVHKACEMYFNEVSIENTGYLDIVCDEAISSRLIPYKENNP